MAYDQNDSGFSFEIVSDIKYNFLVARISYNRSLIAILTREHSVDDMQLVWEDEDEPIIFRSSCPAEGFIAIIKNAMASLRY